MSAAHQAGKGDRPRPVDKTKWDANWHAIKWKSKAPKQGDKPKPTEVPATPLTP